jgi:hypothetical protein
MWDLLVPVQAVDIICASGVVTKAEWIFEVVEVGDEQLPLCTTGGEKVRVFGVELEGFDGAAVFGGS